MASFMSVSKGVQSKDEATVRRIKNEIFHIFVIKSIDLILLKNKINWFKMKIVFQVSSL